jgi:hypothetical protein
MKGATGGALMALQAGADVNHKDERSRTALHLAAEHGHAALAQGACWAQERTSTRQTGTGARRSTGPHGRTSPRLPRCCWRTGPKSMRAPKTVGQRWVSPGANPRWRRCSCSPQSKLGSKAAAPGSRPVVAN